MTINETAQDLADKILKKFWMTMNETAQDLADENF